ncbi:MAG: inorganic phosphate transporter [Gammaproteobacteria bacterium]|nr:inorganic phosphate transporter [Gammaproteobacteria bacterium]
MITILFVSVCFLAYANGANDNFKGVASLYGSGTASYRAALLWATITTLLGSFCALYLAKHLIIKFSGKGLVDDALVQSVPFITAVASGAGATVILATRIGFPISTTHALLGAMAGSGWLAAGNNMNLAALVENFVLPLLLSPLLAVLLAIMAYSLFLRAGRQIDTANDVCLCVEERASFVPVEAIAVELKRPGLDLIMARKTDCAESAHTHLFGFNLERLFDRLHILSAGTVCFARGLNDTPKIAALLLLAPGLSIAMIILLVSLMMAVGGLLNARNVAETMSHKITEIDHRQGFAANTTTALMVIIASQLGMPVSTTHVTVGALFGIGVSSGKARWNTIASIVSSWMITLPCAAFVSAAAYLMISRLI